MIVHVKKLILLLHQHQKRITYTFQIGFKSRYFEPTDNHVISIIKYRQAAADQITSYKQN